MAAVNAPAPESYAIVKMDDAKAKDWLTHWEGDMQSEVRNRYCDKVMGEEVGWLLAHVLDGFYYGYLATHDTKWVDFLVDWTDSWIKRGMKEPDGGLGWPKTKAAGTDVDQLDNYDADSMLGEAMALRAIVLMAAEIQKSPALQQKYGAKAREYVALSKAIYAKWEKRCAWRETKGGGMISVVLPYGLDEKREMWAAGFDKRNDPGNGFSHPENKANEIAMWLLAMYDATRDSAYRDRAEKWFKLLKSRMTAKADGTYEIWNYWQAAGPWDYKPNGATKHWVGVHPNAGYYFIDTDGIVAAYQHGLVFRKEDLERLIATALATNRHWEALVAYNEEIRDKFEVEMKPGSWGSLTSIPRYLAIQASLPAGARRADTSNTTPAAIPPVSKGARRFDFASKEALTGWAMNGDVAIDATHGREGKGGALRLGPGGNAAVRLREENGPGKVEFWIHDEGTIPADPKAPRRGPRWGLVQADGKVIAPGIFYAPYLDGAEGYTASICDGKSWFDKLVWLGVNRAPAGWHKWTLDFDAAHGLRILIDDTPAPNQIDSAKLGLKGFNGFAIWGDEEQPKPQTIWIADLAVQ